MTHASFDPRWIDAARHERDWRAAAYPRMIADGKRDAERATLDYQAWVAIVEWLEQGRCRLIGGWGGAAEPPVAVISWALLELSAAKALASLDARTARVPADETQRDRRDAIWCIHNLMVKQRELVEPTTRAETAWARTPVPA